MAVTQSARFPIPKSGPESPWETQFLERKSRFLTQACHCKNREESRAFWLRIQDLHPDATHNCWAFAAGAPGEKACIGYSDDGEPRGTAGRPMLNVLLHCGIGQICVVVSRWFGGIKLGAGGLARAYQEAVLQNLQTLPVVHAVDRAFLKLTIDYASLPTAQRLLPDFEAQIERSDFGETAELIIALPLDRRADFAASIAAATRGHAKLADLARGAESR